MGSGLNNQQSCQMLTACCPKGFAGKWLINNRCMAFFLPLPFIPSRPGWGMRLRTGLGNRLLRPDPSFSLSNFRISAQFFRCNSRFYYTIVGDLGAVTDIIDGIELGSQGFLIYPASSPDEMNRDSASSNRTSTPPSRRFEAELR